MAEEKSITNYKNIPEKDWDIFISWHDDKGKVRRCGEELKLFLNNIFDHKKNIFFSRDIPSEQWREHIKDAFEQSKYLFILLTDVTFNSCWVNLEYGAFYMKVVLGEISNEDILALKLPGANIASVKSPLKDIAIRSTDEETALLSFLMRIDKGCKRLFDLYYSIFKYNIAQIQSYDAPVLKEYVYDDPLLDVSIPAYTASTSIDDISFDSIDFNYKKPEKSNGDIKQFFGRVEFVNTLHDEFAKGNNCLNVVATGGMGKTSVAHRYIEMFGNEYENRIIFVTSNQDIQTDFNTELRNCLLVNNNGCDKMLQSMQDKNSANVLTKQIVKILSKATKKSLLIIDVNIDKEHLKALDLAGIKESKYWNILYLSRKKIDGAKQSDKFALPNFEDDLEGATGLFNDIYKDNGFDETQLKHLFELVYHHPLLIEQLAAYGARGGKHKSYEDLCDVLSDVIDNDATDTGNKEGIWLQDKYGHDYNVCSFMKKVISYSDYSEKYQYILRHFVWWQYDYIMLRTINKLLKNKSMQNFENYLSDLVDQMIFSVSDKGYRIHGVLRDVIRRDLAVIPDIDYSNYTANVKKLLESGDIYGDILKCIDNTPLIVFGIGSTKNYSVYEDWHFLRRLAEVKETDTELSELAYKAYLLKVLYNNSGEEIYRKVYGEYKNVSSHLIYHRWLENREEYDRPLPPEQTENGITFILLNYEGVEFKMIKVSSDYYIAETQVTQELWEKVMGYNPSRYNGNLLNTDTKDFPVECVSWYKCMDFIIKLNKEMKFNHYKFSLPSEKEWEYAASCRGMYTRFSGTDNDNHLDKYVWYKDNSEHRTHPVKNKKPNELGIYDMSGNVEEWCIDDPKWGVYRISRGGAWNTDAYNCLVGSYSCFFPENNYETIGFRLLLRLYSQKK